jgi:hypothetical protein
MSVVRERYPIIVPTPDHANPSKIWLESYRKFLAHLERLPGMSDMLLSLIVVIVPGGLGLVILRPRFWAVLLSILPALIVAVLEFLVIGTRYWPAFNDHHPRYLLGSILLLLTSLTLLGCLPWLEQFTRKQLQLLGIILAIVMALVIHHRFGPPHPGRARELLESYFGTQTAALREHNCQALGFSYWEMWPALWHAHLVQHEHGLPRHDRITAVGIRSEPLTSQWQRHPNGLRIWIRKTDLPEVEAAGLHRGLMPFELIEDHGGWAVYHTRWRLSPSR